MARPAHDTVTIESQQGGDFSILVDRATQWDIATDLTQPSSARFELGDDGTWSAIRDSLGIGRRFTVSVNGFPRVTGRLLTRNLQVSPEAGGTVQVVVRTRLADAMFTACDTKIGVRNTTLRDIVIAAFRRMGLTEQDFIFEANLARDPLTGRSSARVAAPDIRALTEEEARPHAPETVYNFVDRHLSRFGLLMWDAPDGRIVIGKPDDTQRAVYRMLCRRGEAGRANNVLRAAKVEDYEQVPRDLWVFGVGGGRNTALAKVKWVQLDTVLFAVDPPLDRSAIIIDESLKTQAQAEARARREMMRRSLMKDSWRLTVDGLSYWSGSEVIEYLVDVVADVQIEIADAASGPYLIHQVSMRGNAQEGQTTELVCAGKGVWAL